MIKKYVLIILICLLLIDCSRYIRSYKLRLKEPAFFTEDMAKTLDYKYFKLNRPKSNDWYLLKSEQYVDHCVIHYISKSETYTAFFQIDKYDAVNNMGLDKLKDILDKQFFTIKNKERFEEKSKNLIYETNKNEIKCIYEQIIIDKKASNIGDNEYLLMRNTGYILYNNSENSKLLQVMFTERGIESEIKNNSDEENYLIKSVVLK